MLRCVSLCAVLICLVAVLPGCKKPEPPPPPPTRVETPAPTTPAEPPKENAPVPEEKTVLLITTDKGSITVELFDDRTPITAGNFLLLAEDGFYSGLTFHRVVPGFVIQGGDPKGNGSGGPGFTIPDEVGKGPTLERGMLSMAKTSAPDTAGSQFFIVTGPRQAVEHLSDDFTTFGKVLEGMDVVDKIEKGDKIEKIEVKSTSANADAARQAAKSARKTE